MDQPLYDLIDPSERLFARSATLDLLHTSCRFAEGPAWFAAGRYLLWSDIPNDRVMRWDECNRTVSIFRAPAHHANGHTVDRQGRLVSCEHSGRRMTRTEFDGSVSVLADRYEGRRLNSPNDVVVKSDGSIWFTDSTYGIDSDYLGDKAPREQAGCHVYRIDPASGAVQAVATDFVQPNGLAFSPDESVLYIADSGRSHVSNGPAHIRRFAVGDNGHLTDRGVLAECTSGLFDGFRVDTDGRLWTSTADGVHVIHPNGGQLLGKIRVPNSVSNVCFGGAKRNYLFITATTTLYGVPVLAKGAKTV